MFNPCKNFLSHQKVDLLVHINEKSSGFLGVAVKIVISEAHLIPLFLALGSVSSMLASPLGMFFLHTEVTRSFWLMLPLELTNIQVVITSSFS